VSTQSIPLEAIPAVPAKDASPPAAATRRELQATRRELLRRRNQALYDLGGLTLEMRRRGRIRADLIERKSDELLDLEAGIRSVDGALATMRRLYVSVRARLFLTVFLATVWATASAWFSVPWIDDLARTLTLPFAVALVAGIAIVPGYLNVHLAVSLLVDRPRRLELERDFPDLTLLIAAYDEEDSIEETLAYALGQDFPGRLAVVVADDGSSDRTGELVARVAEGDPRVRLLRCPHGGKAKALNAALAVADTPLVATIDADTLLVPSALRRAVARLLLSPEDTVAVAGSVLTRNSRVNFLARMQEWDYFLGIASVKRQQALLQGTLVAQGAFSLYKAEALRAVGGWPDRIGEDIVLTWAMLCRGGRTTFEPTAVGFTEVPVSLKRFVRQRQRWARGMIEGLRDHGRELLATPKPHAHSVLANLFFPYLDGVYTFALLPGVVLALAGNYAIVGPMTLAVLPLTALVAGLMFARQRRAFEELGLRVRRNWLGLLGFLLVYQPLLAPVSFAGYVKELVRTKRVW
jgi:biofilm PGA synthesis N-glycosyltransferase PgaC